MNQKRLLACLLALLCAAALLTVSSMAQRRRGRRAGSTSTPATAAAPDNGCGLSFAGSSRKAVKLRKPGLNYTQHNGGRAIAVSDFFSFVCTLDPQVPTKRGAIPETQPLPMEKETVKMRVFVLAMKLDPDNDLHVQVADAASPYRQQQLIVEIPPGADYCTARSALMDLFRADGGSKLTGYVFHHPPQVELTGYLFLDAAHMRARRTDFCTNNGGRGIKNGLSVSPVRGIWEVHPVISLRKV